MVSSLLLWAGEAQVFSSSHTPAWWSRVPGPKQSYRWQAGEGWRPLQSGSNTASDVYSRCHDFSIWRSIAPSCVRTYLRHMEVVKTPQTNGRWCHVSSWCQSRRNLMRNPRRVAELLLQLLSVFIDLWYLYIATVINNKYEVWYAGSTLPSLTRFISKSEAMMLVGEWPQLLAEHNQFRFPIHGFIYLGIIITSEWLHLYKDDYG